MCTNAAMILMICGLSLAPSLASAAKKPVAMWNVSSVKEFRAAAAKIGSEGGTINLAPGDYVLDKPVRFAKVNMVNLVGSGWNTALVKKGDGDAIVFVDCGFCVVRNMRITSSGNSKKGSGIVFQGYSSSNRVDFCRICVFPESGALFEGSPKNPQSSNTVSNCHFIGNLGDQLKSVNNNDFYIIGNQFGTAYPDKYPRTGCLLDGSSAGTYTMNYHWGNVNAFRMLNSHFNRIENNRFEQSRETGLVIGEPTGGACYLNIMTGNTIHTNSEGKSGEFPAVLACNADSFTFCANQVFSWDSATVKHKSSLILEKGCHGWIVKDNILGNNVDNALVYDENAGHIVKDNITN